MTVDVDKSDLDMLFLCPEAVEINKDTILPFVMILPHRAVGDSDLEVFFLGPQKVLIKVTIPTYLTQPDRFTPVKKSSNAPKSVGSVTYNSCMNHYSSLVDRAGDKVSYKIVLDLPFAVETKIQNGMVSLQGFTFQSNGVSKSTYTGPSYPDDETFRRHGNPADMVNSLILIFKKVDDGFKVKRAVVVHSAESSSSDDEAW
jgi:hypothetical protein